MTALRDGPRTVAPPARDPRERFVLTPPVGMLGRKPQGWDRVLAGAVLALALVGALLVWAATRDLQRAAHADPQGFLYRDLINIGIGAALVTGVSRLDARLLRLFGPVLYVASVCGLLLVFVIGTTINGAHAWIQLGAGVEVQPAEYMKLSMIVGMAVLFSARAEARAETGDDGPPAGRDVLLALGLVALPVGLILLQPDLGSAMVLGTAAFGVLLAADVRARWTIGLIVLGVAGAVLAIRGGLLASYQVARITNFAHPHQDLQGAGYNVHQAKIAVANGGLFGRGLFDGPQTNGGYVPEQQTDFVFSVAGEEFGLVGGLVIIALLGTVCWRALRIARDADATGRIVAVGIVCWFAFQAFENIGMNLGLTPVTGVPLPFVSYGGSSMFAGALAIGLLQAIRRRNIG